MPQTPEPESALADSLDLVRLAQRGELVALGELFARYYPRVQALVRQRLNPEMRAEMESGDLLQEAMLDAIRGFGGFEVRSHRELIGWFARIVENNLVTAARHMRAQKRERAREVPLEFVQTYLDESAPDWRPVAGGPDPIEVTSQREQQSILEECLAELEPEQRRVIELRHGQHSTWAEIATALGRPGPDAARMLYARARIQLQKSMRRRGGETPA